MTDNNKVMTDGTIIEFLLGEKSFNGIWFGDKMGDKPFGWRKYLREHIEEKDKEIHYLQLQVKDLQEQINKR